MPKASPLVSGVQSRERFQYFLSCRVKLCWGGVSLLETAQDPACLMVYHCRTQSKISERKRHMGLSLGETSIRLPRVLSQWSHRDTLNSLNSKTWQFVLIVACREPVETF